MVFQAGSAQGAKPSDIPLSDAIFDQNIFWFKRHGRNKVHTNQGL